MTIPPQPTPDELFFKSGLPGMDHMLQRLVQGDNVVLKVGAIEDYIPFATAFYKQCLEDEIPLVYFRFARHRPIVPEVDGVERHTLQPELGFERFITEILDVIEQAGRGACYVFDCLSELAVDWYSERMLGNFFMLTCPYLYRLDTIAYFALLRNRHSSLATDAITNTAQVVMDVYQNRGQLYVHPLKVEGRYTRTMYFPHEWNRETGAFVPVQNSGIMSAILTETEQPWLEFTINRPDVWMYTFQQAREATENSEGCDEKEIEQLRHRLIRMALTREDEFINLVNEYFGIEDVLKVVQRMIGTGLIGGKSLGMLLARAITLKISPDWDDRLEPHDSFFIGSDVFYTYLVLNKCWWLRRRKKGEDIDRYLERAKRARERILQGAFPEETMHQFTEMLNYFGQSPIIVRSSSLQEDNYGNAFSGKYESVFCANQGTPEERMKDFLAAVRCVYASTMSREALLYRYERGLLDSDEQMALLVQRVSGSAYDDTHFFPQLAGVGYSYNPYVWSQDIDPNAGLLRLVMGLGTRAVDRTEDDYTCLVALNQPLRRPQRVDDDIAQYAQRRIDTVDLESNDFKTVDINMVLEKIPDFPRKLITSVDKELIRRAREHGKREVFPWMFNLDNLLKRTSLAADMQAMMTALQEAYGNPVDIEYTVNFISENSYLLNLVQCRPFQVKLNVAGELIQPLEEVPDEDVILETAGPIIGQGVATRLDRIIYINPKTYSRLGVQERYSVARVLGRLNHLDTGKQPVTFLIGPGRWGTSSPSLGVPVNFSEINTVSILCEMAVMHEGLVPDISLGTHFFNDLVEMDLIYMAVHPEKPMNRVHEQALLQAPNKLAELLPEDADWEHVIHVVEGGREKGKKGMFMHVDATKQRAVCHFTES
jgi:pyruvate,water dikinase